VSIQTSSPRPAKDVRDALRRDEIVAAARQCMVRHGFHAASMAEIAKEARMSVGQIYRYFPSKEAIIHSIVERIVERRLAWIRDTSAPIDFPARLASRALDNGSGDADDRMLLMDATAEAARNPEIAEIMRKADRQLHAQAVAAVRRDHPALSQKEAVARVEIVAVLSEGTAFRMVTDRVADVKLLTTLYRELLDQLLPAAPTPKLRRRTAPA
jgi:AcrR family transcriptional regulator